MCLITYRRLFIDFQCCSVLFFLLIKECIAPVQVHISSIMKVSTLQRPSKLKLWSAESMDQAMNAVLNEGMSIRHAAEHYAVPKSTLGIGSVEECHQALLVDQDGGDEELVAFLRRCVYPNHGKNFWHLSKQLLKAKAPSMWMVEFFYQETPRYYTKSPSAQECGSNRQLL